MPAISFQPPVYASPAFASGRPQPLKASVQPMPQCQFSGGKVAYKGFFHTLKTYWAQLEFAWAHWFNKVKLVTLKDTHEHELGHMLADYASGNRPLGITFNTVKLDGREIHAQVLSFRSNSQKISKVVKDLWGTLAGGVFESFQREGKGFSLPPLTTLGMRGDIEQAATFLKTADVNNSYFYDDLIQTIRQMRTVDPSDKARKAELGEKYIKQFVELLEKPAMKRVLEGLMQVKEAIHPDKLEKLRQGVLNKGGWMFGKTFRTQLYEKIFTAAERQQFEKIYQEFEREFLALPEIQALGKQPS